MDRDKCSRFDITYQFPLKNLHEDYNNSSLIEFDNFYDSYKKGDLLFNRNDDISQTSLIFQENEGSFLINQNENYLYNDEVTIQDQAQDQLYFISSLNINKNNLNTNIQINSKSLDEDKSKSNQLFEFNKELPPKYFSENLINDIIIKFDISEELKLNLLFDSDIKNKNIEQLKRVLESDTKKRRKKGNKSLYRTDHILRELINIINSSLLNFINNLICALYTKEKIYQILDGIKLLNEIKDKDMKEIIKKIDYKIIGRLESKEKKLNLLNSTLKNHFSAKISSTYTKYPSNYNELIIDKILNDEDNKNIFDFIFNDLLIKDWIEIFLYKKDFKDFDKYILIDKSQQKIIKENLERVDKYINKIYKKHKKDKIYFHCFFLIAYNLYRFLLLKEKRNKNKNEEEDVK